MSLTGKERGAQLREMIFQAYEAEATERRPNGLRPSELGKECERALWYRYRWADTFKRFEGRMHRLFETGHSQEDRMVADLRKVGAHVYATDPSNPGKQIPMKQVDGHSKGFLDGVAENLPFALHPYVLFEAKTHSVKMFKKMIKEGVEKAKPEHFAQMQLYMHEHNLLEGLYMSVCKDNDDIHCEFFDYNQTFAERLIAKANRIVYSSLLPLRIHRDPGFFKCRFCDAHDVCHSGEKVHPSCRTCEFGMPANSHVKSEIKSRGGWSDDELDGPIWYCVKHGSGLSLADQKDGCSDYVINPEFTKED